MSTDNVIIKKLDLSKLIPNIDTSNLVTKDALGEDIVLDNDKLTISGTFTPVFPKLRYGEDGHMYADYPPGSKIYDGASNPSSVSAPEDGGNVTIKS